MFLSTILGKKGQSLVEYLIIVALVGVATMAVVRVVGANVSIQFAHINEALGGKHIEKLNEQNVTSDMVKRKDITNFFEGSRLDKTEAGQNHEQGQ